MDGEGFPLPLADNIQGTEEVAQMRRASRYMEHQDNEVFPQFDMSDRRNRSQEIKDKESGETITRRVMVLRKPFRCNSRHLHSNAVDDLITERPVSLLFFSEPKKKSLSVNTSDMHSQLSPSSYQLGERKIAAAAAVKVSQSDRAEKFENQSICISTWKEFLFGRGVLHPKIIKFNRQENGCDNWYKLCSAYMKTIRSFALYCMWIKRILLLILRICVPVVGARLMFCHFILSHVNIHKEGKEKCLNAKFCGAPFGGVNLYAVRTLYCPYCRDENEIRMTSKYFESTNQERRMLIHKMAK